MKVKYYLTVAGICLMVPLQGCVGTVAGAATSTAIQVAKVPVYVAGALVGAIAHTAGAIVGETSDGDDE